MTTPTILMAARQGCDDLTERDRSRRNPDDAAITKRTAIPTDSSAATQQGGPPAPPHPKRTPERTAARAGWGLKCLGT